LKRMPRIYFHLHALLKNHLDSSVESIR